MNEDRKFGLTGKARARIYLALGWIAFAFVLVSPEYRYIAIGVFFGLLFWIAIFDPVSLSGERTFLGLTGKKAKDLGIGSVFGRKPED